MSRSKRKTPIFGTTTAVSEAWDKRFWHRALRRHERSQLQAGDLESFQHRHPNDVATKWNMEKDGKGYWTKRELAESGLTMRK